MEQQPQQQISVESILSIFEIAIKHNFIKIVDTNGKSLYIGTSNTSSTNNANDTKGNESIELTDGIHATTNKRAREKKEEEEQEGEAKRFNKRNAVTVNRSDIQQNPTAALFGLPDDVLATTLLVALKDSVHVAEKRDKGEIGVEETTLSIDISVVKICWRFIQNSGFMRGILPVCKTREFGTDTIKWKNYLFELYENHAAVLLSKFLMRSELSKTDVYTDVFFRLAKEMEPTTQQCASTFQVLCKHRLNNYFETIANTTDKNLILKIVSFLQRGTPTVNNLIIKNSVGIWYAEEDINLDNVVSETLSQETAIKKGYMDPNYWHSSLESAMEILNYLRVLPKSSSNKEKEYYRFDNSRRALSTNISDDFHALLMDLTLIHHVCLHYMSITMLTVLYERRLLPKSSYHNIAEVLYAHSEDYERMNKNDRNSFSLTKLGFIWKTREAGALPIRNDGLLSLSTLSRGSNSIKTDLESAAWRMLLRLYLDIDVAVWAHRVAASRWKSPVSLEPWNATYLEVRRVMECFTRTARNINIVSGGDVILCVHESLLSRVRINLYPRHFFTHESAENGTRRISLGAPNPPRYNDPKYVRDFDCWNVSQDSIPHDLNIVLHKSKKNIYEGFSYARDLLHMFFGRAKSPGELEPVWKLVNKPELKNRCIHFKYDETSQDGIISNQRICLNSAVIMGYLNHPYLLSFSRWVFKRNQTNDNNNNKKKMLNEDYSSLADVLVNDLEHKLKRAYPSSSSSESMLVNQRTRDLEGGPSSSKNFDTNESYKNKYAETSFPLSLFDMRFMLTNSKEVMMHRDIREGAHMNILEDARKGSPFTRHIIIHEGIFDGIISLSRLWETYSPDAAPSGHVFGLVIHDKELSKTLNLGFETMKRNYLSKQCLPSDNGLVAINFAGYTIFTPQIAEMLADVICMGILASHSYLTRCVRKGKPDVENNPIKGFRFGLTKTALEASNEAISAPNYSINEWLDYVCERLEKDTTVKHYAMDCMNMFSEVFHDSEEGRYICKDLWVTNAKRVGFAGEVKVEAPGTWHTYRKYFYQDDMTTHGMNYPLFALMRRRNLPDAIHIAVYLGIIPHRLKANARDYDKLHGDTIKKWLPWGHL